MSLQRPSYRAAWVPTGNQPTDAEELAVAWTQAECDGAGRRGTLVAGVAADEWERGATGRFIARNGATTPRSDQRGKPARPPLLVMLPDRRLMIFAVSRLRDGDAVCMTAFEGWAAGWAEDCGAIDLTTGQPTPDTRTADQLMLLDDLADQGYQGWTRDSDERRARPILADLAQAGVTSDQIPGTMIARGSSDIGIRHLAKLIGSR